MFKPLSLLLAVVSLSPTLCLSSSQLVAISSSSQLVLLLLSMSLYSFFIYIHVAYNLYKCLEAFQNNKQYIFVAP